LLCIYKTGRESPYVVICANVKLAWIKKEEDEERLTDKDGEFNNAVPLVEG